MTAEHMSVPCIVCNKALPHAFDVDEHNQPYGGISCQASGQYGCTVFDPMDGSYLEFNVCDECLVEKADAGVILISRFLYDEVTDKMVAREPYRYWEGPKQYRYDIDVNES